MVLLYRGTRDGMTSKIFHDKCDNQGKTITLYRNDKGHIFGGYASIPWSTEAGNWVNAPDSFIFTLTNIYNYNPSKLISKKENAVNKEVYHNINYGPTFGNDVGLYSDFRQKGWSLEFKTYQDYYGKSNSLFIGKEGTTDLIINEIEVYKLI